MIHTEQLTLRSPRSSHLYSPKPPPLQIESYHSLYPLELWGGDDASATFQCLSDIVKGVSAEDGRAYTLRRLDPAQVPPTAEVLAAAKEAVELWAPLARHAGVAALRSVFVSKARLRLSPAPGCGGPCGLRGYHLTSVYFLASRAGR